MELETRLKNLSLLDKVFGDIYLNEKSTKEIAQEFKILAVENGYDDFIERKEIYDSLQRSFSLKLENALKSSAEKFVKYHSSIKKFEKHEEHIQRFVLGSVHLFSQRYPRMSDIPNLKFLFRYLNKMRDTGLEMRLERREIVKTLKICEDNRALLCDLYENSKGSSLYDNELNSITTKIIHTLESNLKAIDIAIIRNKFRRLLSKEYETKVLSFLD